MIYCKCGFKYPNHVEKCQYNDNKSLVMRYNDALKNRYYEARYQYYLREKYEVIKDGFYYNSDFPKVKTANGLTKFICNFLIWNNFHATRISSAGRFIESKNDLGHKTGKGIFIPSTTRKGTADIRAIIKGKAVDIEIKIGADKASEFQLREQELIRKAGGIYEFIKTPEQFFELYNRILYL